MKSLREIFGKKVDLVYAYRATFETPTGEVVLAHLAKNCHVLETTFVPGDPYASARAEGERRVVLSILKMLGTDISKLQRMMEQQNEE